MSDDKQPAEKQQNNKEGNGQAKAQTKAQTKQQKQKELQKDAQVLRMLEEDEDDFEEFEENVYDSTAPQKIDVKQWREDWDDEDINDEFGVQLRKELGIH